INQVATAPGEHIVAFLVQSPTRSYGFRYESSPIAHKLPLVMDELFTGRVEERTPLLSIKLPEKFLRKYYSSKATMEYNVNRLTTTRDVALTLKDLATMDFRGFKRKHSIEQNEFTRLKFSDTPEFKQLFEYTKKEILRNDCLEDVVEDSDENTLKVMSLNPMVQQGIRGEKE
ncbi:unnamed protein product, partial [Nippostrongylus brasiliensis]|uniref:SERPIN domain-containing protein n=1 Tax=Nippostrongylus brasiliensis TaxID=27835 RepID=A0A0N4YYN2_NIPBR